MVGKKEEQELWDVYDENRIRTGKLCRRCDPLRPGEYHLVVHVCILNSKNEMLIQQRQPFKHGWPNMWDVSIGGSAIAGDTSSMAAEREVLEELGIQLNLKGVRPEFTINFNFGFDDYFVINKDVDIEKEVVLQESEVKQVKWASEEEVLRMIDEGTFIPYSFISRLFTRDYLRYGFSQTELESKILFATDRNLSSWMNLIEIVRNQFPGLETEEKMNAYRDTVIRFINRQEAICAVRGNIVVGTLLFSKKQNMICFLAVHPEFRRRGIATGMVDKMMTLLDPERPVIVGTFREGDPLGSSARAFYKNRGFKEGELCFFEGTYPEQMLIY